MKTGTPASNPGARRYFQRPGPRRPRGQRPREAGEHRQTSRTAHSDRTGREQTSSLAGHGRHAGHHDRVLHAMFQGAPPAQAGIKRAMPQAPRDRLLAPSQPDSDCQPPPPYVPT